MIQVSSVAAALVGAFSLLTSIIAQPVDIPSPYGPPVEVGAPEIIAHRINPNVVGAQPPAGSTSATSPILYHTGGTVLPTPNVYLIWYGNWAQGNGTDIAAGQQIVRDFLHGIGGSPYFNINTSYSLTGFTIDGNVNFGGETPDNYSQGKRLSDSKVQAVVRNALSRLGTDPNGVYFVLTSSDVSETSGFCTRYCGWHTHASLSGSDIKYSFVGNAARCISGCAAQTGGPNGNAGVDGMVSVIAHELEEATSDPDLNAWFDASGAENADKCAWTFGTTYPLSTGAYWNVLLANPSRYYLIQRNLYHGAQDYCGIRVDNNVLSQSWLPTP
jgi:Phosphate-induced protein 1 conserved region